MQGKQELEQQAEEATSQQSPLREPIVDTPKGEMTQEKVIANAEKISSKALDDLINNPAFEEFVVGLNKNPSQTIAAYASTYTMKVRESGLNSLPILMTAGSLIITGMVNMLAENGVADAEATRIQNQAMEQYIPAAISNDRQQNGYTDENTPPDGTGGSIKDGPTVAPSAMGGE